MRNRKLIFAGWVGRDGKPELRETIKGSAIYGLDNEGKATVLFRVGDDGEVKRVAEAAPSRHSFAIRARSPKPHRPP